jgi:hypothetical protein
VIDSSAGSLTKPTLLEYNTVKMQPIEESCLKGLVSKLPPFVFELSWTSYLRFWFGPFAAIAGMNRLYQIESQHVITARYLSRSAIRESG